MANLGTLDQMGYGNGYGTDVFNKYMAQQIATKGSDLDKLLYLIGGAAGNAMRVNREGRENKKLDKIIEDAKNPVETYFGGENGIGVSSMTPEQQQAMLNQSVTLAAKAPQDANSMLSVGTVTPEQSAYYSAALDRIAAGNGAGGLVEKRTNNGMNNYNWDYVMQQARDQGISNKIIDARKAEIQNDISKQADAAYLPSIQKDRYGYTDENGNRVAPTTDSRLRAMEKIGELAKYSPETAKAYQTLAVNGMQGDVNYAQKKELAQMQIDAANAKQQRAIDAAYNKQIQSLQNKLAYDSLKKGKQLSPKEMIEIQEKYATLGEELRAKYGNNPLPKSDEKVQLYFTMKNLIDSSGNQNQGTPGGGNPANANIKEKKLSLTDTVDNIVKATNFSNYGDDAGEGKYNFLTGTQAIVDYLRKDGKNDSDIYKFVDRVLADAEKAGELPAGYRQDFAHSMNVKTKQDEIDEALAAEQRRKEARKAMAKPWFTDNFGTTITESISESYKKGRENLDKEAAKKLKEKRGY